MGNFKEGRLYYYKRLRGDWRVATFTGNQFRIDEGLYTSAEDMVLQCGIENLLLIPSPEELSE